MPLPSDTATALGFDGRTPRFLRCDSRSLVLDRCADPNWKDSGDRTPRRDFFREAMNKRPLPCKCDAWLQLLSQRLSLKPEQLIFGQLQSRLMINMAGGVMENAGLCLDRFGMPYIPGSAVKGCSRRMAIQRLLEAESAEAENVQAKKADLLVQMALVFGWCEQDWKLKSELNQQRHETDKQFQKRWEKERSDFAYACGDLRWSDAFIEAVQRSLWKQVLRTAPPEDTRTFSRAWKQRLSHFAGKVQFLPAYPLDLKLTDPFHPTPDELGELELDVVTVHHKKYYAGPERPNDPASVRAWECDWGSAPDIEEPVPVVFPAVAPGHVFVFGFFREFPVFFD